MPKLKLSELKKLEWNPRTIKKEDLDKLTKSIEKFWVIEWRPFLVSNRTGENIIIWGNQRYEVCKKLGITEVPVHIMEWLTEEEEKEIIIRDNISNWEWDWDILANEWDKEDLEEWWLDVQFETVEPEAEEDDFEVACHQLNRKCYMSELDPKYVQTIVNRMQKLDPSLEIKRNWLPYTKTDFTE